MIKDLELESSGDTEYQDEDQEDPLLMQAILRSVFEDCMVEYFIGECYCNT